jgi:hypothetical protein
MFDLDSDLFFRNLVAPAVDVAVGAGAQFLTQLEVLHYMTTS